MRATPRLLVLVLVASALRAHCQAAAADMATLVGRKAVAQRMPFYKPGTYEVLPNTYAGQTVTIVEVKPSAIFASMPKLSLAQMASLPSASRAAIENTKTACTIIVQFPDGTRADTGVAPVMASTLPTYLELQPDPNEKVATQIPAPAPQPVAIAPNASCPMTVQKATSTSGGFAHALAEGLTKSEFQRALEKAQNGGHEPHYLDVRIRNAGNRPVRALEAYAVYTNAMGDPGPNTTITSQNTKVIKPGNDYIGYAYDTSVRSSNGIGDVMVFVSRVRFEDNTFWQDNGSHSCSLTSQIK